MKEKELRLALVCYGGISLAVYMHGVTKEIWHLNRASRDFLDDLPPAETSRGVYHQLLAMIAAASGVRVRVLTDILSGSSAGGINAVFLAKALVSGRSLEPLTSLWLDFADVDILIDPDARPVSRMTKFWAQPLTWAALRLNRTIDRTVSPEARREVSEKISRFVRARWFAPPFGGSQFTGLLIDALDAIDNSDAGPTLLPAGQPLDLFVTVTDFYGYSERLRLHSPHEVEEDEHRLTMGFSTRGKADGELGSVPSLAFAARATASFPGAFPPFRIDELDRVLASRNRRWEDREQFLAAMLPQHYRQGVAEQTVLIDGSVLANAPFRQALGALRNRPARREVDRRFVYIDPKPGSPGDQSGDRDDDGRRMRLPGFFQTLLAAISTIPRAQPIRDSLEQITGRSNRAARINQINALLRPEIEENIGALLGRLYFRQRLNGNRLGTWRLEVEKKAARTMGLSYSAYSHLRIASASDEILAIIVMLQPGIDPSDQDALRDFVTAELSRRGIGGSAALDSRVARERTARFLREHDLRFRVRRMRFVARRFAEEIEDAERAPAAIALLVRPAIYDALALCLERETSDFLGTALAGSAAVESPDVATLIDLLAARQSLEQMDRAIDTLLADAFALLPAEARQAMLVAYLGFPLFDLAVLPLMESEGQNEFNAIKIDRIAPDDAVVLRAGGAAATLRGIEFNSFGAFFCRAYRENDYLWGRLHGADRLIDIVNSTIGPAARLSPAACTTLKQELFRRIVAEERARLTAIPDLLSSLDQEIEAITGKPDIIP